MARAFDGFTGRDGDEAEQGQPDPGYGYGLGFMQDLKVLKDFGNAVEGGCKK